MNLYAVKLLPRVRLRFCQFLGIASELAMQQLDTRLESLERKLTRFEAMFRRLQQRQMALEVAVKSEKTKTASPKKTKPKSRKTVRKKTSSPSGKKPQLRVVATPKKTPKKSVLLIACDTAAASVIKPYFKNLLNEEVKLIQSRDFAEVPKDFAKNLVAVFFDRRLLAQSGNSEKLQALKQQSGSTPWVGLSNYLTLNLAEATGAQKEESAGSHGDHFLTLPLRPQDLAATFTKLSEVG